MLSTCGITIKLLSYVELHTTTFSFFSYIMFLYGVQSQQGCMDRIQECLMLSLGSFALNCRVLIQAHLKFLDQVTIYFNNVCMKFQETCTIFFFFFHRIFKLWGSRFGWLRDGSWIVAGEVSKLF